MAKKRRPARLVFLGALTDAQDLAKSFRIDRAGHQQADVTDLARPAALHDYAIQVKVRMLAFDAPVPPGLDLGVDLLVQVRHRTRAHPRAPQRLRDVLYPPHPRPGHPGRTPLRRLSPPAAPPPAVAFNDRRLEGLSP